MKIHLLILIFLIAGCTQNTSVWWLKPQTYGMFNYYKNTNYSRLHLANCTVNGYRLIYDITDFNYTKYVAGFLIKNTDSHEMPPPSKNKKRRFKKAKNIINSGLL